MYLTKAVRTTSSLSRRRIIAASRATFSSSTIEKDDFSNYFYKGTVKFYRKDKKYGIITPDDNSIGDVFIHRMSILSDDDSDINNPFLKPEDRVKFTTVWEEDKPRAQNVTFVDGTRVPKKRSYRLESITNEQKKRLGGLVYGILSSDDVDSKSQDDIMKEIKDMYNSVAKKITNAKIYDEAERIAKQKEKLAKQKKTKENISISEDLPV